MVNLIIAKLKTIFCMKTIFVLSLPPVICRGAHILLVLLVFACPIVVSNTYCVVYLLCLSSSCVHYVASFSEVFFFVCHFGII
jgi:hypothetical protein